MRRTRGLARRGIVLGLGLVWALMAAVPVGASSEDDRRLSELTRAFETFDARDMDGRRWTTADLRGRVVVLDFWATWCPPCWREIPWLKRIQNQFDPSRVQVIGVSLDVTDRRTLVAWLNRRRVDWPQIWESYGYDSPIASRFGVDALPTSVLVDADGRVVAVDLRGARLLAAVDALLGGVSPFLR